MKSYKNIFKSLFCLALGVGMTACSSDSYDPAPQVSGMQVFFSAESPSTYELKSTESTFDIEVSRVVTAEAAEIPVEVTTVKGGEGYTFPTSVKFEEGDSVANMTVSYDADKIGFDNPSGFTVSLADDKYATPYGVSTYSFKVVIPAPWSPWCSTLAQWEKAGLDPEAFPIPDSKGTCTYTYGVYWQGDDPGLKIFYRQNLLDPTIAQFRVDDWATGLPFYIDFNPTTGKISIAPQKIGLQYSNGEDIYAADPTSATGKDLSATYPCTFDPVAGRFEMNLYYYLSLGGWGPGVEVIQIDGYYVPDYTVSVKYTGILTDPSGAANAQLNLTEVGVDVAKVLGTVVEASADADAVADALASGDLEGQELSAGVNNIALGELTGELKVVVAALNADGELVTVESSNFEYYGGGKSPWKSIGKGLYCDDVLGPLFGLEPVEYAVEIFESEENPGVYRVMDPYAYGIYPNHEKESDGAPAGSFLTVNAEDPEGVYVPMQSIGVDWGYGVMSVCSYGGYYLEKGYTVETLKGYGVMGKVTNGVITFPDLDQDPDDAAKGTFSAYLFDDGGGYYAGINGKWAITLPSAVTGVRLQAAATFKSNLAKMSRANKNYAMQIAKGKQLANAPMRRFNF